MFTLGIGTFVRMVPWIGTGNVESKAGRILGAMSAYMPFKDEARTATAPFSR